MSLVPLDSQSSIISNRWIDCRLTDTCTSMDYGLTASATDDTSGVKFLRITDIVSGHVNWDTVPYVTVNEKIYRKYQLRDGDIVIARTGASTGASAFIQSPPKAVFASYLVRLNIKPKFDPRFLAYYLKSEGFWSFMRGVLGDKSAQPNASASTMGKAPLNVPELKTDQRRIAHILGTLDDKIELNRRMNATLEGMVRALFQSWFVDFEPVRAKMEGRWLRGESLPGKPAELYDLFPERLVPSEFGDVPEGWRKLSLNEVAVYERGSVSPSKQPGELFEHYSIPAFDKGEHPSIDLGANIKSNKTIVPLGAVLLSKLNPHIPRVWIPDSLSQWIKIASTEFLPFTPSPPAGQGLLYCLFRSVSFRMMLESMVTGTSKSHQRVQPKALLGCEVVTGDFSVFQEFESLVAPMFSRLLANRLESRSLSLIRDTLLPRMVTGSCG